MCQFWIRRCLVAALWTVAASGSYSAPKSAVHTVVIEGMQFTPGTLVVNAGDTVIWTNKDPFPHTATADKHAFDSGSIEAGKSWQFVASRRGDFSYFCDLHKTMKAVLVVH